MLKFFDADPGWKKFGCGMEKSRLRDNFVLKSYFESIISEKERIRILAAQKHADPAVPQHCSVV
jgi:hypothetical protein